MRTLVATVAAAAVLVGGANLTSYAATGRPLVLGKANTANRPTSLTNTGAGPALVLGTRPKAPPLRVTSSTVVPRLNADRVDGKHAADLATKAWYGVLDGFNSDAQGALQLRLPQAPAGSYLLSYSVTFQQSEETDRYCLVFNSVSGAFAAYGATRVSGIYPQVSGTAVVSNPRDWVLFCQVLDQEPWQVLPGRSSQVVLTRLGSSTKVSLTPDTTPLPGP